jgi:hypothetical protein
MGETGIGWFLYGLHQFTFVTFLFVFAYRPALRPLLVATFIPIFFFHVSGYGCPFTRIERYYHGQNITIIDPFLKIFGIPVTNPNRKTFQAYFSSLLLFSMVLTVYVYPSK